MKTNEHDEIGLASVTDLIDDGFTEISQLIADAVKHIHIQKLSPNVIAGIATCFPSLDRYTSGFQRGDLIVVAGRPCMGKRCFVRNIVMYVALANGLPVAILENESGGVSLAIRMLASLAKVGMHDLRTGRICDDESARIDSAAEALKNAPIHFSSLTPVSVNELSEQLRRLNQKTSGLGLIVVDCLQELKIFDENINDDYLLKIARTSRYFKTLAKELNVAIIVFSPIERGIEERSNKRPRLTDLPGKGAIYNAADLVLIVYRDEVYDTESEDKGILEIIISKNLRGAIGSVRLKFDGRCGYLEEIVHG